MPLKARGAVIMEHRVRYVCLVANQTEKSKQKMNI